MGIKIVKEKKATDYTFIDDSLNFAKPTAEKETGVKKDSTERDFRLRDNARINKLKHRSKATGGQSMQGHSPVYE